METDNKSSYRSRGRIAQVLAQARASLQEPSRPFTPASLDERSSGLSNDSYRNINYGSNNNSNNNTNFSAKSILREQFRESFNTSNNTSDYDSYEPNSSLSSKPMGKNAITDHSKHNNNNNTNNNLQIIIYDVNDIISNLENELVFASNRSNHAKIHEVVGNLSISVDKLIKFLKDSNTSAGIYVYICIFICKYIYLES